MLTFSQSRFNVARMCVALIVSLLLATCVPSLMKLVSEFQWPGQADAQVVVEPPAPADPDESRKEGIAAYLSDICKKDYSVVRTYVDMAWMESSKHPDMSPELVLAVMKKESCLAPEAKSFYGAEGLMQVVPRIHYAKLKGAETFGDVGVNIRVGTEILQEYLSKSKGNLSKALAKYSGNADGYAAVVKKEKSKLEKIASSEN